MDKFITHDGDYFLCWKEGEVVYALTTNRGKRPNIAVGGSLADVRKFAYHSKSRGRILRVLRRLIDEGRLAGY